MAPPTRNLPPGVVGHIEAVESRLTEFPRYPDFDGMAEVMADIDQALFEVGQVRRRAEQWERCLEEYQLRLKGEWVVGLTSRVGEIQNERRLRRGG